MKQLFVKRFQLDTTLNIYQGYCRTVDNPVCIETFKKYKPWFIRKGRNWTKSDFQHECPYCGPLSNKSLEKIDAHQYRKNHQQESFAFDKLNFNENECLIVQDFSKHYIKDMKHFNDLVLVLYTKRRNEAGELVLSWRYFDYHVDKLKQNWQYVATVWNHFFVEQVSGKFSRVLIWSDGGPAHFTVKLTMIYWSYLVYNSKIPIIYNFFEPYHGANLCDSHTGIIKQGKRFVLKNQRDVISVEEYIVNIISLVDNTEIVQFSSENISTLTFGYEGDFHGLRKQRQWIINGLGLFETSDLYGQPKTSFSITVTINPPPAPPTLPKTSKGKNF